MPLNDLNKEIYKNDSEDIVRRVHEQSEYDPGLKIGGQSPFQEKENWAQEGEDFSRNQRKKILMWVAIFLAVVFVVGGISFYVWWIKNAFHQDRVSIVFDGPKEVDSAQLTKYVIKYSNNNRVTLKNAEIQLSYSQNFQPTDNLNLKYLSPTSSKVFIGDIKPMSQGSIELKGLFYAPKDFPVYLNGQIHFVPSNGQNALFVENNIGARITAAPVILTVNAPKQAVDGDSMEYVIDYKNLDNKDIANVQVRLEFPQGFEIDSATPKASEGGNIWYIGTLEPNQGGKIRVNGKINGNDNESKNIFATLGYIGQDDKFVLYDKQELITMIVSPVLTVTQKLDNSNGSIVSAGEMLNFSISFKNNGDIGLRDAIITVEMKGKILDFSKVKSEKSFFDSSNNVITWKASNVPELANINPQSGGLVKFSVPVKALIPIENELDRDLIIISTAKIDSPDIPTPIESNKIIGSNKIELKLASKTIFDTKGFYNDSKIKNTGPIPMEVSRETTFTLHWSIASISSDITGAKIISSLPIGTRWTGEVYPKDEKISYNARTNEIVWEAGDVFAGTGAIKPAKEVAFQVGVTPQINQIGFPINLLNKSIFTAKDSFVDRNITFEGEPKNTLLREDPFVNYIRGKVAK